MVGGAELQGLIGLQSGGGRRNHATGMALFEFELARVEDIVPWESSDGPSLSWFALTDGRFRMPVGDQVLFEYSDEIMAHWETDVRTADYQIAAFVREMLGSVAAGAARLPERIERLASDWDRLSELRSSADVLDVVPASVRKDLGLVDDSKEAGVLATAAWRWLGERSPWASYLAASPSFQFVRIGDELQIHWDNRDRLVDGHRVWTAQVGVHAMSVASFVHECRDFASRLLIEMDSRIAAIEAGTSKPRKVLNPQSLREQQEFWRADFDSYFKEYQPDIEWHEAERALELIANKKGLSF